MGYQRVITMGWQRRACEKHYKISMLLRCARSNTSIRMKTVSIYCRTLNQKMLGKFFFFPEFNKSWAWAVVKLHTPIEGVSPTR